MIMERAQVRVGGRMSDNERRPVSSSGHRAGCTLLAEYWLHRGGNSLVLLGRCPEAYGRPCEYLSIRQHGARTRPHSAERGCATQNTSWRNQKVDNGDQVGKLESYSDWSRLILMIRPVRWRVAACEWRHCFASRAGESSNAKTGNEAVLT